MSYNITSWDVKEIKDFKIPIESLYKYGREDYWPDKPKLDIKTGNISISCGCEQEIHGKLEDGILNVKEIDMFGEGYGTFFHEVFNHVLGDSKGILKVSIV